MHPPRLPLTHPPAGIEKPEAATPAAPDQGAHPPRPGTGPGSSFLTSRTLAAALGVAALVTVLCLAYVKWWPYYHRLLSVAATRQFGAPEAAVQQYFLARGVEAAWAFTARYFDAVWQATVVGILAGGAVEALVPPDWVRRWLAGRGVRPALLAGLSALPGMMCSCCAAPVAVGLRRRQASAAAALAFWMGNPVLNPATLAVLWIVLGWKLGLIRLVFGLVLVLGVSYALGRFFPDEPAPAGQAALVATGPAPGVPPGDGGQATGAPGREETGARGTVGGTAAWLLRWLKASGRLAVWLVPEYALVVFLTGLLGGFLWPGGLDHLVAGPAGSSLALVLAAVGGTLMVIPTMAEIPIVQGLMALGLPTGAAAALLVALPAVSLPSLIMVSRAFPRRMLVALALAVMAVSAMAGVVAALLV